MPRRRLSVLSVLTATAVPAALLALVPISPAPAQPASAAASAAAPAARAAAAPAAAAAAERRGPRGSITMYVISGRPDLVTGGDARVAIAPIKRVRRTTFRIRLNGREVTRTFAMRATGRYEGLVTGLRVGRNVLTATGPGRRTGRLVITNHPNGGPVFTGPQLGPYRCQEGAADAQCNQPPTATLLYKSSNPSRPGLQPYDRSNPPDDVATTTTDRGVRVPFIVLREDGYQDRDRYTIMTLFQPGKPWTRWKPQRQFNHKILIPHGGNCGSSYTPGTPPLADYSGTLPEETPGVTPSYLTALGRGFGVISTALANTGHNCSVAMNAESLLMAKEHFVERYGTIRYTIGTGCSGGSIAQHTVSNAYPGIYQGLVTTCSYPDTLSAGAQFADYHLLRQYFEDPSRWAPGVVWSPTQFAQVEGHITHLNAVVADEGLYKAALDPENPCSGTLDTVAGDPSTRYDDETNPRGVRCSVLDTLINQLGPRPRSVWGAEEQAAGRGFGGIPFANAGVVYGLGALRANEITTAQFLDLNEAVGGLDVDSRRTDERTTGDPASVARAYRTGLVNEANHLDQVAMLNFGGPDPGIAHDYAHAFWTEERLQRDQGHTDNRVMWFGAAPLIGDPRWANEALLAMDRWLRAVERDRSRTPLARKIVVRKPAGLTDRCANAPGILEVPGEDDEVDCVLPESAQLRLSTPREVAGDSTLNDRLSCALRPLARSEFDFLLVPLTDSQWARLQAVFPGGVCDYSVPGIGQGPAETWLTYSDADGDAVYGGRNLPALPRRSAEGWSSRSFREILRY